MVTFTLHEGVEMRFVKVVSGRGLFANPTGQLEIDATHGVIPYVRAESKPTIDCMGIFYAIAPRIWPWSRPMYRFVNLRYGTTVRG